MITVNPSHTKRQLFELCKAHCEHFLTLNKIPLLPVYNRYTPYRGFYQPGHKPYIVVNLDNVLTPRYNPTARSQSFPNHKTDTTPTGVLAHEYGHAVDWHLRTKGVHLARHYRYIKEPQVTSYDTTAIERVAEAMRLFILNPDLLRIGRPQSYAILSQYLTPTVTAPWYTAYAPVPVGRQTDTYIHYATQWAKRGNKQLVLF